MKNFILKHSYFIITTIIILFIVLWIVLINEGNYGTTLFFTIPASIGFLIGYTQKYRGLSNSKLKNIVFGFFKILVVVSAISGLLILAGLEGAICIIMAYPFLVLPMFFAYLIGVFIANADSKHKINSLVFIIVINPTTYIYDSYSEPINDTIYTEKTIPASKQQIWQDLSSEIEFKNKPNFLFKKGVTYPKSIKFTNHNNQLSYNCITNNDTISLKIIEYIPEESVKFVLKEQTIPMKEISPYKNIDAKHLHNYFAVNYGEIALIYVDSNKTKIVAKTAYNYKIAPKWYWKIWSNYIIDEMQSHVITSIGNKYDN